jgi:hypothetical protein
VKALGLLVVTDIRLCEKLRYVGVQTSTCRPPDEPDASAEASPGALSAPVVASSPPPASLPPELDPLEPLLELLPELLVEPPVDPLLVDPDPDDPLDPLDPRDPPLLDPPPEEGPPSSDGSVGPPSLVLQPAAIANATNATHHGRARVDRLTATTTDERFALLLIGLDCSLAPDHPDGAPHASSRACANAPGLPSTPWAENVRRHCLLARPAKGPFLLVSRGYLAVSGEAQTDSLRGGH